MSNFFKFALLLVFLVGCESPTEGQTSESASTQESTMPEVSWKEGERTTKSAPATGEFKVKFETSTGDFTMLIHRDWAPRGAERFYQLIKSNYYDGAPFYRVVPKFMVQFGMSGDPKATGYWDESFLDDPVKQSNTVGRVTYAMAGPNTRSTQLFINYADNSFLNSKGFAPFGEIVDGMENVMKINSEYGERPRQDRLASYGNKYAFKEFPNISYIIRATFVEDEAAAGEKKAEGEHKEGDEHAKGEHKEADHKEADHKEGDHKEGEAKEEDHKEGSDK
ncbi:MAG: peptidylprolyl isomerase [Mariniblastus sp.]